MRTIASVFGRSPFVPLQSHMEKVAECVEKLPEIYRVYAAGDQTQVEALAAVISKLEHQADQVKDDIRSSLPRGLFMPVDRTNLLAMVALQDNLADRAENIAVIMTLKACKTVGTVGERFETFLAKNIDAFQRVREVIGQLDELLESGFGGAEAAKVKEMVHEVAVLEHDADVLQRELLRELMSHEDDLSYADFFLWTRLIRQVAGLSNQSENLANNVRVTLEK